MQLDEAKEKFTQSWGTLGSSWGINRTMAQIHALLLVTNKPLCAEDIMASLQISRGNANMNLRALMDWGLVHKEFKTGERREFFTGDGLGNSERGSVRSRFGERDHFLAGGVSIAMPSRSGRNLSSRLNIRMSLVLVGPMTTLRVPAEALARVSR